MTINYFTYDEWIKLNPECDVEEICEICGGSGKKECGLCDCGDCKWRKNEKL